jgi:cytoskeletal protein CcmA (bactofilin family)
MAENTNNYPTTIGADAVFKGELTFEKGMRLLGKFEGEIKSSGELVVAEGATLQGDVNAGAIRIDGIVKGNLDAATKVSLTSSARLEGDVQAQRLEVAEGAVLIGRCVVGVNGKNKSGDFKAASKPAETVATSKDKEPALAGKK